MSHDRFRFALIAAAYVVGVYIFIRLPSIGPRSPGTIPFPWFPRTAISFFFPTAGLIILLIVKVVASKDPLRENYDRFRRTYDLILDTAVVLIIGVHLLIIGQFSVFSRYSRTVTQLRFVPTALVGIVLVVAGNILPRLRPNNSMGIRTPWALRDERVWTKTHRAGGYTVMIFGLALLAMTFIDFQKVWWVIVPSLILTLFGLPLLSYVFWRRLPTTPAAKPVSGPAMNHKED